MSVAYPLKGSEGRVTKIMVVGGSASHVNGSLSRKFGKHGIVIAGHVGVRDRNFTIPRGVQAVVILKDNITHPLWDKAKDLAVKAGIPWASVSQKWSVAERSLQVAGILPPATNGTAPPSPEDLEKVAVDYVADMRRQGRVPKHAEVTAVLKRGFGPKVVFSMDSYEVVHSKACVETPVLGLTDKEKLTRLRTAIVDRIEEKPRRLLDLKGLADSVLGDQDPRWVAKEVSGLSGTMKARFTSDGEADQDWTTGLIRKFVRNSYEAYLRGERGVPTQPELDAVSLKIFGFKPSVKKVVRLIRIDVLGEWSRDLIKAKQAYTHYRAQKGPTVSYEEFKGLLEAGKIRNYFSGQFFTSAYAVDEYLAGLEVEETPVVEEPVVEVKTPTPSDDVVLDMAIVIENTVVKRIDAVLAPFKGVLDGLQESHATLKQRIDELATTVAETNKGLALLGGQVHASEGARKSRGEQVREQAQDLVTTLLDNLHNLEAKVETLVSQEPTQSRVDPFREMVEKALENGSQLLIQTGSPQTGG